MDSLTTFDKLNRPHLEFGLDEISSALTKLSLKWVTLSHYIVVMSGRIDAVISGEPFLTLQLWLDTRSGRFMSRVWDQRVASGTVVNMIEFIEVCTTHFRGRPCIGYPTAIDEMDKSEDFVTSQTPVPRKISKACTRILNPDNHARVQSCPECFKLGVVEKEEVTKDYEALLSDTEIRLVHQDEDDGQVVDSKTLSESDYPELQGILKKELSPSTADLIGPQNQGQAEEVYPKECGACKMLCHNRLHFESHKCKIGLRWMDCEECEEPVNIEVYPKHMFVKHGRKGTFYKTCEWCKKQYSVQALMSHARERHFYGRFLCLKKCTFRGDFAAELVSHMTKEHPEDFSAICPACKENQHIQELKSHYEKCIDLKIKKWRRTTECKTMCANCGKTFKNMKGYQSHIKSYCKQATNGGRSADENILYQYCDKCGKGFNGITRLRHHIQSAHDKIEYTCPQCTLKFPTVQSQRHHINSVHSTDEKLKCKHCGQQFESVSRRKVHEACHGDPKFQCRHCPKKVKTATSLMAHERYHTGEKPFKCSICDSGFVNLTRLRQHEKGMHKITGPRGGKTGWNHKSKEKLKD